MTTLTANRLQAEEIAALKRELASEKSRVAILTDTVDAYRSSLDHVQRDLCKARREMSESRESADILQVALEVANTVAATRTPSRPLAPIAGGAPTPRLRRPSLTYGVSHGIDDGESYADWYERRERGEPARPLWEAEF